jgi:hypothetical protein
MCWCRGKVLTFSKRMQEPRSFSNGKLPASIAYSITPILHTSALVPSYPPALLLLTVLLLLVPAVVLL